MNCIDIVRRDLDNERNRGFEFMHEQNYSKHLNLPERLPTEIEEMVKRCKTCLYADMDDGEPVCLALGTTLKHMNMEECTDCYERGDLLDVAAPNEEE